MRAKQFFGTPPDRWLPGAAVYGISRCVYSRRDGKGKISHEEGATGPLLIVAGRAVVVLPRSEQPKTGAVAEEGVC